MRQSSEPRHRGDRQQDDWLERLADELMSDQEQSLPSSKKAIDLGDLLYWILRLEPSCIDDVYYAVRVYTSTDISVGAAMEGIQRQVIQLGCESQPRAGDSTYCYILYAYVAPQLKFDSRLDYMDASELTNLVSGYDCLQTEAIVYYLQSEYHALSGGSTLLPEQIAYLLTEFYGFAEGSQTQGLHDCYSLNLFTNWRSHELADKTQLAATFGKPEVTDTLTLIAEANHSLVG